MTEKEVVELEGNKEAEVNCCTDIEKKADILKYGLPIWLQDAIADWNADFIYIKNSENHIELGIAQVNLIR